jgi:hypothetical protein
MVRCLVMNERGEGESGRKRLMMQQADIHPAGNRQTMRVMWPGWAPLLQILVVSSTLSEKTIKVMGSGRAALLEIHTPCHPHCQ